MKYYVTIDQERLNGLFECYINRKGDVVLSQNGSAVMVFDYCTTHRLQADGIMYEVEDAYCNRRTLWLEFAL